MKRLSLIAGVLSCIISTVALGADSPFFRGPNWNGIYAETGLNKDWKAKPPKQLWRTAMTDNGYAGPCVAAGKLFIVDHKGADDIVRAIDIKSGENVWSFTYPDAAKDNFGFTRATPSYENGKLYTFSRTGVLNCLDAEKGAKVWSRELMKELGGAHGAWDYAGSPFIDGEKIIIPIGGAGHAVVAVDKATGKDIWKGGGDDEAGYATPVLATLDGKKQYLIFTGLALVGVDTDSGKMLWRSPWQTQYNVNAAMPLVIGNSVFISSNYGAGCSLVTIAGGNATTTWKNKDLQAHFNSPLLHDGYIYGISDNMVCMDPKTGTPAWKQPGFEKGGLIAADGVIIALTGNKGDLVMVELSPKAYKELGRITPLGGQSWTAPILADGKLYIRNKQALVCLDAK
ncbi:MAG TPA: PQQ-binding-like beta-propeller repeat protein [Planctomycetota bacterium]|jgi:outer membrane protein assembly factor BamB